MAKNLLIVESPAKAKTIEKILGSDFQVKSCYGHIRDLDKGDKGIDIANNYKPNYIVSDEKTKVVSELKALAKSSQEVWLATDEDREGEAISWHLCEVLKLNPATTKRIVFHEITKPAILKAVANPRLLNLNVVNAQQARRVLDRLVGFELSPVLWRKMSMGSGLSAGRVQSVAVRLIAEREREITNFTSASHFNIVAQLLGNNDNNRNSIFKAEGKKIAGYDDAIKFLESCKNASYTVKDITVKPAKKSPSAPFTTSTLQQEASRKLGYGVSKTMLVAQKLYESGKITYMRTDSVNLSDTARLDIVSNIETKFGKEYIQERKYKNKNESAQEAHEAIRPTYMSESEIDDYDGKRLYELIWKRTIASQMADAQLEKTVAQLEISTNKQMLTAEGEVLKFDGFLKVYLEGKDDEEEEGDEKETMLPALKVGQICELKQLKTLERFSRANPRYTEASLVKKLEELGIGRPSTYAPTISTIIKRTYVEKRDKEGVQRKLRTATLSPKNEIAQSIETENTGAEKSKLFPTDLGLVVTDFLSKHFTQVMDYQFTAQIEAEFDLVAEGKKVWSKMIDNFYVPFHATINNTMEHAERASGERALGEEPGTGKKLIARMGRYGPMVQIGETQGEEKPKFAKLKANQSIETITYQEAMDLFKLPLELGEHEGKEVVVNIGRFGPYVRWGEQFISLPKGQEALEVTMEMALEIIAAKQIEDAPVAHYKNLPVTKGKGRFGPFIKWNDVFVNIPRAYDIDTITQADCEVLIDAKMVKEANRFILQFPELKISVENGRWGPFIKFNKKMLKLSFKKDGTKYTPEEAALLTVDEVKEMVLAQVPNAFDKKTPVKKAASKTATPKKVAAKKTATKKAVKK